MSNERWVRYDPSLLVRSLFSCIVQKLLPLKFRSQLHIMTICIVRWKSEHIVLPGDGFVEAITHSIKYCETNSITQLCFNLLILCLHHKGMSHIKGALKPTVRVLDKHLNMQYYNTKTNIKYLSTGTVIKKSNKKRRSTYGFVGEKINMDEYGSMGLGPVISSSSSVFFSSSFLLLFPLLLSRQTKQCELTIMNV